MSVFAALRTLGQAISVLTVTETVMDLAEKDKQSSAGGANTASPAENQAEEESMSPESEPKSIVDVIEVEVNQLASRVKHLIDEGNVRKLIIRDNSGKYLVEVPLTIGVLAGGVFAAVSPVMTAVGAVAGAIARVQIEVVRIEEDEPAEAPSDLAPPADDVMPAEDA